MSRVSEQIKALIELASDLHVDATAIFGAEIVTLEIAEIPGCPKRCQRQCVLTTRALANSGISWGWCCPSQSIVTRTS